MKLLEKTSDETLDDFFEDAPPLDLNASFYQMNLSRPLLKVNCDKLEVKFDFLKLLLFVILCVR